jgi:PAS domain S-box-containing protein
MMGVFSHMRIRNKIFVGYLAAILAVIGVAALSWSHMRATDDRFRQVLGDTVPRILLLEQVRDKGTTLIDAVNTYANRTAVNRLRTYTVSSLESERRSVQNAERELANVLAPLAGDLREGGLDEADPRRQVLAASVEILGYPADLLRRVEDGATVNELLGVAAQFDASVQKFRALIDRAIGREELALAQLHQDEQKDGARAIWALGAGIFLVIVLTLVGGYSIADRIARPVVALQSVMARVGDGDFSVGESTATRDEVGQLLQTFRGMVVKLQDAAGNLRESEVKFRTMLSNIPGVCYRCANDAAYTMEFISPAIEQLAGYPAADFIGNKVRTYASLIHPEDVPSVDEAVTAGVTNRRIYIMEYRILHRDGSVRWVREHGQGVFDDAGLLLHLDGAIFDVTERHDMEIELRQALDRANDAMDKLSRQERLATLGQVAGTVSHELRNPLASIRSSMALIRQLTANKGLGLDRALERIDRNIERCNGIIADLLEFTRRREVSRAPVEIDAWIGETLDEHALAEGVTVVRELASDSVVALDCERFRQVMVNLLDNAAQAMSDESWTPADARQPTIVVRTEAAGPHVRLSVVDNGPGIPVEQQSRIFEPLFTTKSFGVGLGLPTVRRIVEQHGGTIAVESAVEGGTSFIVWLPRHSGDAAARSADQAIEAA